MFDLEGIKRNNLISYVTNTFINLIHIKNEKPKRNNRKDLICFICDNNLSTPNTTGYHCFTIFVVA